MEKHHHEAKRQRHPHKRHHEADIIRRGDLISTITAVADKIASSLPLLAMTVLRDCHATLAMTVVRNELSNDRNKRHHETDIIRRGDLIEASITTYRKIATLRSRGQPQDLSNAIVGRDITDT